MTLDGYFEGSQHWDLSFHDLVWGEELRQFCVKQLQSARCLVFGRVTYEGMAAYWQTDEAKNRHPDIAQLMNSLPKLVFSRTLHQVDWNNSTIVRDNLSGVLQEIKKKDSQDIFVFGSAVLSESFMKDSLYDEYRICVAPVILGQGRPLFRSGIDPKKMTLASSRQLLTGGVVLTYKQIEVNG